MMKIKRFGFQFGVEKTWNQVWVVTEVYTIVEVLNKLKAKMLFMKSYNMNTEH